MGLDEKGNVSVGNLLIDIIAILPLARLASWGGKSVVKIVPNVVKNNNVYRKLLDLSRKLGSRYPNALNNIYSTLTNVINLGPGAIVDIASRLLSKVSKSGNKFSIALSNFAAYQGKRAIGDIIGFIKAHDKIKFVTNNFLKTTSNFIRNFNYAVKNLPNTVKRISKTLNKVVTGVSKGISKVAGNIKSVVKSNIGKAKTVIKTTAKKVYHKAKSKVKKAAKKVYRTVKKVYHKAKKYVKKAYNKAKNHVKKTYSKAKSFVKKVGKKVYNTLKKGYNVVKKFFRW